MTSPPSGSSSAAGPMLYSLPGPRRCVPATCTSPSAASRSASRLGHGHQLNATGGSSSPSGASSSGSAGSQPAATRVGRGVPMGRTFLLIRPRVAVSPGDQPASREESGPARRHAPQRKRDISVSHGRERDPGSPRHPAARPPLPRPAPQCHPSRTDSSTVMPSARASAKATRKEGSDRRTPWRRRPAVTPRPCWPPAAGRTRVPAGPAAAGPAPGSASVAHAAPPWATTPIVTVPGLVM